MKINLEVKHEGETYLLRIKKTVYKGIEMYYENIITGNWLFQTWRNGKTLEEVSEKWDELLKLNNVFIFGYCKSEIEECKKCNIQCDHCKIYYKPLEDKL